MCPLLPSARARGAGRGKEEGRRRRRREEGAVMPGAGSASPRSPPRTDGPAPAAQVGVRDGGTPPGGGRGCRGTLGQMAPPCSGEGTTPHTPSKQDTRRSGDSPPMPPLSPRYGAGDTHGGGQGTPRNATPRVVGWGFQSCPDVGQRDQERPPGRGWETPPGMRLGTLRVGGRAPQNGTWDALGDGLRTSRARTKGPRDTPRCGTGDAPGNGTGDMPR